MSETLTPTGTLLEIKDLRVRYEVRGVMAPAVDGVNLSLRPGDALVQGIALSPALAPTARTSSPRASPVT